MYKLLLFIFCICIYIIVIIIVCLNLYVIKLKVSIDSYQYCVLGSSQQRERMFRDFNIYKSFINDQIIGMDSLDKSVYFG